MARPQMEVASRLPSCRWTAARAFSSAALYAAWSEDVSGCRGGGVGAERPIGFSSILSDMIATAVRREGTSWMSR